MPEKTYDEEILELSRKDSGLPDEEFGKDAYDIYCVEPSVYRRYKDEVVRLSLCFQKWVVSESGGVMLQRVNQLSDREIAQRLGLDEDTVMKIRCMAEWDIPMECWRNAAEFKRRHRLKHPLGSPDRSIKNEPG